MKSLRTVLLVMLSVILCAACAQNKAEAPLQSSAVPALAPETRVATTSTRAGALQRLPDVPYIPTPPAVVAQMLQMANVREDDVLYDLGSGDGRIVIMAAQRFGTRGTGVDIDPQRIEEARKNAQQAGVTDRVRFLQQDLFETDLSEATVVTLYLLSDINLKLRPKLWRELKPGTRVVSHDFDMGDWKPEKVVKMGGSTIYYWTIPTHATTGN
jgi:SAM-dependent methyltransferase